MQPWILGRRTKAVRSGTDWRLFVLLVAILASACSPGEEASLMLLGEADLSSESETTIQGQESGSRATGASTGGLAADFDSLLLFPLVVQAPGLNGYQTDCEFNNEPFGNCL